jgi:RNA polymerase sigma factor for flagellar operon FliA
MKKQALAQADVTPIQEQWPEQVDSIWQEQMVVQYAPLIKYIASRLALRLPSHISLDDLMSSGIIGLIDAIHKFDPGKNISFKTYAEFRIKGAILDELRSLDWIPRSVRKKSHVLEKTYAAELERNLGRPAEPEEVCQALGLEMEEFYQPLDETKSVSLVDLEGVWKAVRKGPDMPDNKLPEILLDEKVRDSLFSASFC